MPLLDYIFAVISWCKIKIALRAREKPRTLFKEGEIWWCSIGMNVGAEIFGKGNKFTRPVLIFKKLDAHLFLGIALTTNLQEGSWYVPIISGSREAQAMLSQIRTMDCQRLTERIATLSGSNLKQVKKGFINLYES